MQTFCERRDGDEKAPRSRRDRGEIAAGWLQWRRLWRRLGFGWIVDEWQAWYGGRSWHGSGGARGGEAPKCLDDEAGWWGAEGEFKGCNGGVAMGWRCGRAGSNAHGP